MSIDSGFSAPDNVDGLTDAVITNPQIDDTLVYDGTNWINQPLTNLHDLNNLQDVNVAGAIQDNVLAYNGSSWEDFDYKVAWQTLIPGTTNRYYFPYGSGTIKDVDFGARATLLAIKFNQNVTINKWAFSYSSNGTIASGNTGMKVRGFIYEAGNTGRPHTLHKDLGNTVIVASDDTGGQTDDVVEITLGSSTTLNANTVYYIGMATYPVNHASHTYSAGPQLLMMTQNEQNPFWNNGIAATSFVNNSFGFQFGGWFNAATNWATFDFVSGTLPNNIQNSLGSVPWGYRIGLNVSAIG